MRTGIDIALLGIDGIGKSTIARALVDRLALYGETALLASWRRTLSATAGAPIEALMTDMWTLLVRALHCEAVLADGSRVRDLLPESLDGYFEAARNGGFSDVPVAANGATGLLAAAALETAGTMSLQRGVVDPAISSGQIVIYESHGVKSVIRHLILASRAGSFPREEMLELIRHQMAFLLETARPEVGVVLWGDVGLARNWRLRQDGRMGPLEHFGLVGESPERTYEEFQTLVQQAIIEVGRSAGWACVEMRDRPVEENIDDALRTILAQPALAPFTTREPTNPLHQSTRK